MIEFMACDAVQSWLLSYSLDMELPPFASQSSWLVCSHSCETSGVSIAHWYKIWPHMDGGAGGGVGTS